MYALVELSSRVSFFVCSVYIHIPVTPGPKMRIAPSQLKSSLSNPERTSAASMLVFMLWGGRGGFSINSTVNYL